jgi:hypothetical protein
MQGAIFGLGAGLLVLAVAFTLVWQCLPFRISLIVIIEQADHSVLAQPPSLHVPIST